MPRILWVSPPPWAPSGYGVQTKLMVPRLIEQGNEVGILAYAGVFGDYTTSAPGQNGWWRPDSYDIDVPLLSTAGKSYANGLVGFSYARWDAALAIILADAFCFEPSQFAGMTVMPWMPIDCEPLGEPDRMWLTMTEQAGATIVPVAMSKFGQRMLKDVGVEASYIPHGFDPNVYYYDPEQGERWRRETGIPQEMFLVSMCGVNVKLDRKSFVETLIAFRKFSDKHKDTALYLHTEAQCDSGLNLAKVALSLGLKHRVLFADEKKRAADLYNETYMRGMYNASQLYSQVSKGEGFGVNVLEAQACGTPCVVSNWSAQPELVPKGCGWHVSVDKSWVHHHNSWWCTPRIDDIVNAYERAYSSWKGPVDMSKACLRNAEKYQIGKVAELWRG